jgi:hypothetical protein
MKLPASRAVSFRPGIRDSNMALRFEDVSKFARENGDVKGWAKHGVVTLLKSGDVDSVKFWEEDAVRFVFESALGCSLSEAEAKSSQWAWAGVELHRFIQLGDLVSLGAAKVSRHHVKMCPYMVQDILHVLPNEFSRRIRRD